MLKRLRRLLFGKRPDAAARDLSFYPTVGSSSADLQVDATVLWSGIPAPDRGLDRTMFAPLPTSAPALGDVGALKVDRQRLAWPARDASRSQMPDDLARSPPPSDEQHGAAQHRPTDDMTVLVARRPRPAQTAR